MQSRLYPDPNALGGQERLLSESALCHFFLRFLFDLVGQEFVLNLFLYKGIIIITTLENVEYGGDLGLINASSRRISACGHFEPHLGVWGKNKGVRRK